MEMLWAEFVANNELSQSARELLAEMEERDSPLRRDRPGTVGKAVEISRDQTQKGWHTKIGCGGAAPRHWIAGTPTPTPAEDGSRSSTKLLSRFELVNAFAP